jgi:hypothetical protein
VTKSCRSRVASHNHESVTVLGGLAVEESSLEGHADEESEPGSRQV